jgi:putative transcriptional regulator
MRAASHPGPVHHPSEARLLDYASGALPEPMALLIATHLALCPACRRTVAGLEAVGSALLESLPPEPVADDSLARLLDRIDRLEPAEQSAPASLQAASILPQPLRDYVGPLDRVGWRHFGASPRRGC